MKNKANLIIVVLIVVILTIIIAVFNLLNNNTDNKDLESNEDINLKSKVLKHVIKNNWKDDYDFGSKESNFDKYEIYFDEGIEVRNVEGKIYNIVFTEKYNKKILNNIKSNDSLEDIINEIGQPDFGGESINLIGYKFDDFYIFFNGRQASIYRNEDIEKIETSIFEKNYESKKEFIYALTNEWKNFDIYTENINDESVQYALINYTYEGIRINVLNDEIEVLVYNNCNIKMPENDIYKLEIKNKNLIYEIEVERQNSIHNRDYAYDQYQSSFNNLPPDFEDSDSIDSEYEFRQSEKFLEIQEDFNDNGEYKLLFVNIDGKFPNSEISANVNSYVWVDDYNIAYGVRNKGIYLYNAKTLEKTILKEGKEEFIISGITEDNILKYDESEIKVNI